MTKNIFREKYLAILKLALEINKKALEGGVPSLQDEDFYASAAFGSNKDVFDYGIWLFVDGMDKAFIEKVLTNLIEQEKDEDEIRLKIIQKEAVLAIREGMNPIKLHILLNSYIDTPMRDDRDVALGE